MNADVPLPEDAIQAAIQVAAEAIAQMLGHWPVSQYHRDFATMILAAAAPVVAVQHEASIANAVAAERERIRQLAIKHRAEYNAGDDGEVCCDDECHGIWLPFADLLAGDAP